MRTAAVTAGIMTGLLTVFAFTSWLRHDAPGIGLTVLVVIVFFWTAAWWGVLAMLPHPELPWWGLLPGATLIGDRYGIDAPGHRSCTSRRRSRALPRSTARSGRRRPVTRRVPVGPVVRRGQRAQRRSDVRCKTRDRRRRTSAALEHRHDQARFADVRLGRRSARTSPRSPTVGPPCRTDASPSTASAADLRGARVPDARRRVQHHPIDVARRRHGAVAHDTVGGGASRAERVPAR